VVEFADVYPQHFASPLPGDQHKAQESAHVWLHGCAVERQPKQPDLIFIKNPVAPIFSRRRLNLFAGRGIDERLPDREAEHAPQDCQRSVRLNRRSSIDDLVKQADNVPASDVLDSAAGPARQDILPQVALVLSGAAFPRPRISIKVGGD